MTLRRFYRKQLDKAIKEPIGEKPNRADCIRQIKEVLAKAEGREE